ncbi:MAG: hypothetical protein LBT38_01285 [Deltaproteobacteria bacterium]|jgi:hypothetical protein|nr:hypothetical protein [Deltaproteobacteria bacterium]
MIANNNPAQVSINAPSTDSAVWVKVFPPDTTLDINITGQGEALEVLVVPHGRRVQVRVGPNPGLSGSGPGDGSGSFGPVEPTGSTDPKPSGPSPADSALIVDTSGLEIDDKVLESLSNSTDVGQNAVSEDETPFFERPEPELPPLVESPVIYRDSDGTPPPPEVRESLAQLSDPEPFQPQDDPKATTALALDGLLDIINKASLAQDQSSAQAPDQVHDQAPDQAPDQADDWPEAESAGSLAGEDLDNLETKAGSDPNFGDLDLSAFNLDEPNAKEASLASGEMVPEDTNFDQPNAERLSLTSAPKPSKSSPDSSTAVIVNYLEDTEDSFFEVEAQSGVLSEDEDMDIDLLDQAGAGVLAAKPMIPVPRKAV